MAKVNEGEDMYAKLALEPYRRTSVSRRTSPEDYRRPVEDLADEDRLPTNVHPRLVEHQTSPTPKSARGGKGVRNSIRKEKTLAMNTKGRRTRLYAPGRSNTNKEGNLPVAT